MSLIKGKNLESLFLSLFKFIIIIDFFLILIIKSNIDILLIRKKVNNSFILIPKIHFIYTR
jgi:hypothetical protein